MRSIHERLLDIVEALDRIDRYAADGRDRFDQDELVQAWMVQQLVNIGEAGQPPAVRRGPTSRCRLDA